jgi:ferredoxin--NADP+ reductase
MFKIIESYTIVPNIHILTVEAQHIVPNLRVGNFIILRVEEDGERIPLTPADWDIAAGTITFAVMIVGRTTRKLSHLKPGDFIPTVSGPLGNPMPIEHFGKVLCIGGCYGNGSLFPLCRALKQQQNKVYAVVEARSAQLIFWEDKLKSVTDKLYFITRDGSRGYQGHVAENLQKLLTKWVTQ